MFIEVAGLKLHVQTFGEGTPIVFLHGFWVDSDIMKGFLEPIFEANAGWKRIYIDIPGHGSSDYPNGIHSSDEILEIIMKGIHQLVQDQPFLIGGLSYGGYLARGITYKLPEQVKGMLLLCPMIKAKDRELPEHQVLVHTLSKSVPEGFKELAVVQTDRVWERYQLEVVPGVKRFSNLSEEDFLLQGFSFEAELHRSPYSGPTLIIVGRQDSIVGFRDAWIWMESCPHASFVVLDHAGHLVEIEQETIVTPLVQEWLHRSLVVRETVCV